MLNGNSIKIFAGELVVGGNGGGLMYVAGTSHPELAEIIARR